MWKSGKVLGRPQIDNLVNAHCMLDTYGYAHTHKTYVILIASPLQQWLHNVPQCYLIRTLPVFFILQRSQHNSPFLFKCNIYMCFLQQYYMSGVLHVSTRKDIRDAFLESS